MTALHCSVKQGWYSGDSAVTPCQCGPDLIPRVRVLCGFKFIVCSHLCFDSFSSFDFLLTISKTNSAKFQVHVDLDSVPQLGNLLVIRM